MLDEMEGVVETRICLARNGRDGVNFDADSKLNDFAKLQGEESW